MISDVHFDPLNDPNKAGQLVDTPATQWQSILAAPPSPDQQAAFAELQHICRAKGVDTSFDLFHSSLQAMHAKESDAKFITVSGDLMAHAFMCRYKTLFPSASPADYQAFVVKTLSFVVGQLRSTFPGIPVYVALGNNDSNCGDYQLDGDSDFLSQVGKIIADGFPEKDRERVQKEFAVGGYYDIPMVEPMHDTRLIVVDDVFLSPRYTTCGGKPDSSAAEKQTSWLTQQLVQARQMKQRVWVMGHIPPGVDPYTTVGKIRNVCGGQSPAMFLSSDSLSNQLIAGGDVVKLGLFGHTHMDELRLMEPEHKGTDAPSKERVPIKLVSSISPVDGNNPSFTIAHVNPATAVLEDYEVIAASNQTGIGTNWDREYDFDQTYHANQFSPSTLNKLVSGFKKDHAAKDPESEAFLRSYLVGDRSTVLRPFWPEYTCALDNHTAEAFSKCVCVNASFK